MRERVADEVDVDAAKIHERAGVLASELTRPEPDRDVVGGHRSKAGNCEREDGGRGVRGGPACLERTGPGADRSVGAQLQAPVRAVSGVPGKTISHIQPPVRRACGIELELESRAVA
jgi:hypothetical protein